MLSSYLENAIDIRAEQLAKEKQIAENRRSGNSFIKLLWRSCTDVLIF